MRPLPRGTERIWPQFLQRKYIVVLRLTSIFLAVRPARPYALSSMLERQLVKEAVEGGRLGGELAELIILALAGGEILGDGAHDGKHDNDDGNPGEQANL